MDVVAGLIRKDDQFLVARRPEGAHLAGFWEFPGGKPEREESDREALVRELEEELGLSVSVGKKFHSVEHEYPERTVHIRFYFCTFDQQQTPEPMECEELRWVRPVEMTSMPFPPADNTLLRKLKQLQQNGG